MRNTSNIAESGGGGKEGSQVSLTPPFVSCYLSVQIVFNKGRLRVNHFRLMDYMNAVKKSGLVLIYVLMCQAFVSPTHGEEPWEPLITRLIDEGNDPALVRQLFSDSDLRFDPQVMLRRLSYKESTLDYNRFLEIERLTRAKDYLSARKHILERLEARYGVPKEIEVAILLVETNLGQNIGRSPVFQTFANMAVYEDFERFKAFLPPRLTEPGSIDEVRRRYLKYAQWGYGELKALIQYAEKNGDDPTKIRGSIFGAFGLCQFIPSSAAMFGVDENGDGRVDLFHEEDALASMANYLRHYGWREGLSKSEREAVIFHYNRSKPYVHTVLAVADHLRALE
jgi:membrane-bound lytic murein transglycosylase B